MYPYLAYVISDKHYINTMNDYQNSNIAIHIYLKAIFRTNDRSIFFDLMLTRPVLSDAVQLLREQNIL